jgi:hypothetical protein
MGHARKILENQRGRKDGWKEGRMDGWMEGKEDSKLDFARRSFRQLSTEGRLGKP